MPGFDGKAQFQLNIVNLHRSVTGEAELKEGVEPVELEGVSGFLQVCNDLLHVLPRVVWQQETVMKFGPPAHQVLLVGLFPEPGEQGPQQQVLYQAHSSMGWHFEGSQLKYPKATCGTVG